MDRFDLLEQFVSEFVDKLDGIGFDVLGGNTHNSIELEIVDRECRDMLKEGLQEGLMSAT